MAITCKDICELKSCEKLVHLTGPDDREISWPYIKTMDTLKEWLHGDEIVFVLEKSTENEDVDIINEKIKKLLQEGKSANVSAIVLMSDYIVSKMISKEVLKTAQRYQIGLFKMPFKNKLVDISRDISKLIIEDKIKNKKFDSDRNQSIIELLAKDSDKERVLNYCFMKLQPLENSDKVKNSQLIYTLYVYLNCNSDMTKAAEKLFIHRNTMIQRIKRISYLLDEDISNYLVKNEYINIFHVLAMYGFQIDERWR